MRQILTILLILNFLTGFSQVRVFSGDIDKYPIQLVTYSYSDGNTRAIYAYDKYDTPIVISGKQRGDSLFLYEKNDKGEATAILQFPKLNSENNEITGRWINQNSPYTLAIKLNKLQEFNSYDNYAFDNLEILQPESTNENYFKLLISKKGGDKIEVKGVRIYEKETDRLIQHLELECQFWGLDNISVSDYNFDGIEDFSVFENSYTGPNTSSIYILRDPNSEKYFISEITGTSLIFDAETKLIHEHNQCCAGRSHMNATHKLVDNKMILIERRCIEFDNEKDDFVEMDCE